MSSANSNRIMTPCNVYTLLWCIYYLQGTLYTKGSLAAKLVLIVILLLSVYYTIRLSQMKLPVYFKVLSALLVLYTVYGLFRVFVSEPIMKDGIVIDNTLTIKNAYMSILPIFVYSYFAIKGYITEKWLLYWLPFFLLVAVASFYEEQNSRLQAAIALGSSRREFVNNCGYLFVSLIPYVCFVRKKNYIKLAILLPLVFFIIMSMKRGAILTGAVAVIYFLIREFGYIARKNRFAVLLIAMVVFAFIYKYVGYLYSQSDLFIARLEQTSSGDASGRSEMFQYMINYFISEKSLFRLFFGHGLDSTIAIVGNGAHNDWLQIALDMGVFGLVFYFIYWASFYKSWKSMKLDRVLYTAVGVVFISELAKTFFSFSITDLPLYELPIIGYGMAFLYNQQFYSKM